MGLSAFETEIYPSPATGICSGKRLRTSEEWSLTPAMPKIPISGSWLLLGIGWGKYLQFLPHFKEKSRFTLPQSLDNLQHRCSRMVSTPHKSSKKSRLDRG
jgi:hypothetical protein